MGTSEESCSISIIGTGVIGGGLAGALKNNHQITLCDRDGEKAKKLAEKIGVKASKDIADAVQGADIILLAVKPQDLKVVAKQLFGKIRDEQILVSVLSGITLDVLKVHFGDTAILRMMPNVPCFYGEGVVGLVDEGDFNAKEKAEFEQVFGPLGKIYWLSESKINALTALGGSGPAFVFIMIESMVDAGVALGLSAQLAKDMAMQMVSGAVKTLRETGKHPGELKWEVTSPGGCTIAGIKQLEDEAVRSGIMNTFLATYEHLQE